MQPNIFTLNAFDRVTPEIVDLGVHMRRLALTDEGGEVTSSGRALYAGRSDKPRGERTEGQEQRPPRLVRQGSGAVWLQEENLPSIMGAKAIAGSLAMLGDRDYRLHGQSDGDKSLILHIETGLVFPRGAKLPVRLDALRSFMERHGEPQPHGVHPREADVLALSESDDGPAGTASATGGAAVRLSSSMDRAIVQGSNVSWGRRFQAFVPERAVLLVKLATGPIVGVMNMDGRPKLVDATAQDLEHWNEQEYARLEAARQRREQRRAAKEAKS